MSCVAVVAVCIGTVAVSPRPSGASSIGSARAQAASLLSQINATTARVDRLGQRYDAAQISLNKIKTEIDTTASVVASIKQNVSKGNAQLQADAIFAYVTNGSSTGNNPLFTTNASKVGAANIYGQLAEGNIGTTIAHLRNYRIKLTHEQGLLRRERAQATAATAAAAQSFHSAQHYEATLHADLSQVKGRIATYIRQAQEAAAARSAATLQTAAPSTSGYNSFPVPPPDSRADIAIRAAMTYIGVWYQWGGASRAGVDCSGLVMLAYDAAGIYLPHYSGAQYADTMRVPLYDIQPGDLLFYGYNGDEHVAMYVGHGDMIEAEMTGTQVHIVPIRLGYGFAGLGRPRA